MSDGAQRRADRERAAGSRASGADAPAGRDADASETAGGRPLTVDTTAGPIAYAEYGDPDGAPVLFLHGTPGSRVLGRLYDDEARRRGVRVLAPDRPGYGESAPRPGRSPADAPAFLIPVLDDAGVAAAGVIAFSGGAPYALAMAADRPDRVAGVDLVSGAAPASLHEATPAVERLLGATARTTPRLLAGALAAQAWIADRGRPGIVVSQYTTGDPGDAVTDAVADVVARDFVAAVGRQRAGAVRESRLMGADWDVSLGGVSTPVSLHHGADDANVPVASARNLRDRLPEADLTVQEGDDHLTALLRSRAAVLDRYAEGA
ncbi:alpha/beta fold hydrolase [Halomicrobium urmianum]|uniref:alpha/beta fold hydrolase n=1 Tax=Halomicrobium urmianum TaxID=1586233 RepID=UPI001CDA38D7|nr:alpha/beta hydrolase [Halomicrobium urmianum]